jgi:hypothetical protein
MKNIKIRYQNEEKIFSIDLSALSFAQCWGLPAPCSRLVQGERIKSLPIISLKDYPLSW